MSELKSSANALMTNPLQSYLDTLERTSEILGDRVGAVSRSDLTTLIAICRELREALEFYASEWGPHQGSPIKGVNQFTQNRLNESGEKARQALARAGEICMNKEIK